MKLNTGALEIEIREGSSEDVPLLLEFIRSMAEFEKLEVTASEELLEESLFGSDGAAKTILAFVDGQPAAYAVYFFTFATMVGKRGLWLDDLFVKPEFRQKGVASALLAYLADLAMKHNCGRFEWMVLDWNRRAMDFYRSAGATVLQDWRICRLSEAQLPHIAGRLKVVEGDDSL